MFDFDLNDKRYLKLFSELASEYANNGKTGGEKFENALIALFKLNGHQTFKVLGRKKQDIIIDGKGYSVKSTTTNELQLDTMSNSNITIEELLEFGGEIAVNDFNYEKEIYLKDNLLNELITHLNTDPIICLKADIKNKISFSIFEFSFEKLKEMLYSIDKIIYRRPKNKNRIEFIKDEKIVFVIKDGTGYPKANAFQRGLWCYINNLILDKIEINNIEYEDNITHFIKLC